MKIDITILISAETVNIAQILPKPFGRHQQETSLNKEKK